MLDIFLSLFIDVDTAMDTVDTTMDSMGGKFVKAGEEFNSALIGMFGSASSSMAEMVTESIRTYFNQLSQMREDFATINTESVNAVASSLENILDFYSSTIDEVNTIIAGMRRGEILPGSEEFEKGKALTKVIMETIEQMKHMQYEAKRVGTDLNLVFNILKDGTKGAAALTQNYGNLNDVLRDASEESKILERYFGKVKNATKELTAANNHLISAVFGMTDDFAKLGNAITTYRTSLLQAAGDIAKQFAALQTFVRATVGDMIKYLWEIDEEFHKLIYRIAGDADSLSVINRRISAETGLSTKMVQESMRELVKAGIRQSESFKELAETTAKFTYATGVSASTAATFAARMEKIYGATVLTNKVFAQATYAMKTYGLNASEINEVISTMSDVTVTLHAIQGEMGKSALAMTADLTAGYFAMMGAVKKAGISTKGLGQIIKDLADPVSALNSNLIVLYAVSGALADVLAGNFGEATQKILDHARTFEERTKRLSPLAKSIQAEIEFESKLQLEQFRAINRELDRTGMTWDQYRERQKANADMSRDFAQATETVTMMFKKALLPVIQVFGDILRVLLPILKAIASAFGLIIDAIKLLVKVITYPITKFLELTGASEGLKNAVKTLSIIIGVVLVMAFYKANALAIWYYIYLVQIKLASIKAAIASTALGKAIGGFVSAIYDSVKAIVVWIAKLIGITVIQKTAAAGSAAASAITSAGTKIMGGALKFFGTAGVWKGILALGALALTMTVLVLALKTVDPGQMLAAAGALFVLGIAVLALGAIFQSALALLPGVITFAIMLGIVALGILAMGIALSLLAEPLKKLADINLFKLAGGLIVFALALIPLVFAGLLIGIMIVPFLLFVGALALLSIAAAPLAGIDFEGAIKFFESITKLKIGLFGAFAMIGIAFAIKTLASAAKEFEDVKIGPLESALKAVSSFMTAIGSIGGRALGGMGAALEAITDFMDDYINATSRIGLFTAVGMLTATKSISELISSINTLGTGAGADLEGVATGFETMLTKILDRDTDIERASELLSKLASSKEELGRTITAAETSTVSIQFKDLQAQLEPLSTLTEVTKGIKEVSEEIRDYNRNMDNNIEEIKDKIEGKAVSLLDIKYGRWL